MTLTMMLSIHCPRLHMMFTEAKLSSPLSSPTMAFFGRGEVRDQHRSFQPVPNYVTKDNDWYCLPPPFLVLGSW
jgi:hypothetical protein